MISIKSAKEIEKMERAGGVVRDLLELLGSEVRPGITTGELDRIAFDYIKTRGGVPSFLHYNGYPKSICASIDDEVVHGIPSSKRRLEEGQIVSIDVGAVLDGFHGDAARTFPVGKIDPEKQRLIDVTRECFFAAVRDLKEGSRLSDIGRAVENTAHAAGYSVVRDLVGHGIGRQMHEDPSVPNFVTAGAGLRLKAGMTIAVEPMINAGVWQVKWCSDGWTVKTADGKPSAHYENTVLIEPDGCRLLTL